MGHQLSIYATEGGWGLMGRGSSKIRADAYKGKGVPRVMFKYALISFHVFGCIFVLFCLILFVEVTPTFIQKKCVRQRLFFFNKINFCRNE